MEKSGMTLMERARRGDGEGALKAAAERESLSPEVLLAGVAAGTAVVPANPAHRGLVPCGIGQGLRTKVNANIGTSEGHAAVDLERRKLVAAVESCGETGGNHTAVHEAEVPSPYLGHRGGRAAVMQFCEDLLRRGELQGELFVEEGEVRQGFSVGKDVAVEDGGKVFQTVVLGKVEDASVPDFLEQSVLDVAHVPGLPRSGYELESKAV